MLGVKRVFAFLAYRVCVVNDGTYHKDQPKWTQGFEIPSDFIKPLIDTLYQMSPGSWRDAKVTFVFEGSDNRAWIIRICDGTATMVPYHLDYAINGYVPMNVVEGRETMAEALHAARIQNATQIVRKRIPSEVERY